MIEPCSRQIDVRVGEGSSSFTPKLVKLCRFGEPGAERPAVIVARGRLDVSDCVGDYDEAFFAGGGLERLGNWLGAHENTCPAVPEHVRYASAISRPSKIVCIGRNYREHAAETGADVPAEPLIFFKATSALAGPDDDLVLPRGSKKTDWEVELGVVLKRAARYVSPDEALEYIAGYVLCNDVSEREYQKERGGQWVKGKSADGFAPIGPYLCTTEEVDPKNLRLWLELNQRIMQDGNTKDMIFGVPTLVSYISQFMTLLPGDLICTGTPAGVGAGLRPPRFLREGDVIEYGIDGLGTAKRRVVSGGY